MCFRGNEAKKKSEKSIQKQVEITEERREGGVRSPKEEEEQKEEEAEEEEERQHRLFTF